MPASFVDPRIYGILSNEEKAYRLHQLYPQFNLYGGGAIDDPLLGSDEGEDESRLSDSDTGGAGGPVTPVPVPVNAVPTAAAPVAKPVATPTDPYGGGGWGGDPGIYREPPYAGSTAGGDPGIMREAKDRGSDPGIYRDRDVIPKLPRVYDESPAGPLPIMARRPAGPLPTMGPPPPANRLQPPVDRVALYRQLRPYPGLSKSEKLSQMIADGFRAAAQPGTGNAFRDAAAGYAMGHDSSQAMIDKDRALKAQYAGQVLSHAAGQEEAARKGAETESKIGKERGETERAYAYADYLRNRGVYYTQRGENESIDAWTRRILAMNEPGFTLSESQTRFDSQGREVAKGQPKPAAANATLDKYQLAEKVNAKLSAMYGARHGADAQRAVLMQITGANPRAIPAGSAFAKYLDAYSDPDPASQAAKIALLDKAAVKVAAMRPGPPEQRTPYAARVLGHFADIVDFNKWKYQLPNGNYDWDRFKTDALNNKLERNTTIPGQRDARGSDLGKAVEDFRKSISETGPGAVTSAFGPNVDRGANTGIVDPKDFAAFAADPNAVGPKSPRPLPPSTAPTTPTLIIPPNESIEDIFDDKVK